MIFAELNGKLGTNGAAAHERSEDLLTSTVFGLLRYVLGGRGVLAVLDRARRVVWEEDRLAVLGGGERFVAPAAHDAVLEFWPNWGAYGEPDVVVTLRDRAGGTVEIILIEVKLYSPKSGRAEVDAEPTLEEAPPDPDQLVKYWQGLRQWSPAGVPVAMVYLTAHASAPARELGEAVRRMPGMRLGWLSWFEVHRELKAVTRASEDLPAADLRVLLEHKGLAHFSGFRTAPSMEWPRSAFWRAGAGRKPAAMASGTATARNDGWFTPRVPGLPQPGARFWRDA